MGKEAYKDIWVFAEQEGGRLSSTTFELLAKSHDLKQKLGGEDARVTVNSYRSSGYRLEEQ